MSGSVFIGVVSFSECIFSISLSSRIARDLLTDAIFVRMCCLCVVLVGLFRVYRYRFLAVLESCTSIRGCSGGMDSIPRMSASISAVLMLVVDVPTLGGRYVTLVSRGFILCCCHLYV